MALGTPITHVQEQMGHKSPRITWDVYSHWIPSGDRRWIERLGAHRTAAAEALEAGEVETTLSTMPTLAPGRRPQKCRKRQVSRVGLEPTTP